MARPLEGRGTCLSNGMAIACLVLLLQPVADQQLDATLARFDRRNHDNAPDAALAEVPCADGECRFVSHVTSCYYKTN